MSRTIEAIYEKGIFIPLKEVNIEERKIVKLIIEEVESKEKIIETSFGILKGKNLSKILEEVENEWGVY